VENLIPKKAVDVQRIFERIQKFLYIKFLYVRAECHRVKDKTAVARKIQIPSSF
jgi:hypothetical protein